MYSANEIVRQCGWTSPSTVRCPVCGGCGHAGVEGDCEECGYCKGAGRVEDDAVTRALAISRNEAT